MHSSLNKNWIENVETVITNDGTASVKSKELDESYHSIHGALAESMHVYIEAGLVHVSPSLSEIKILELGFGTGLNALLCAEQAELLHKTIYLHSVEKFPLNNSIINQLNYEGSDKSSSNWKRICTAPWNSQTVINDYFTLLKEETDILNFYSDVKYDVIFFDAFAPRVQPELWTTQLFENMFQLLNTKGVLVTYCAKGEVKRNLKAAGFTVESLPGPKGKREMTRALKNS